jgi:glycosyltransferase involved in cell wall biosynthesis
VTDFANRGDVALSSAGALRVTHLITDLDVGGAERVLSRLVAGSNPDRVRHNVICMMRPGRVAAELEAAGCSVRTLGMKRGGASAGALVRLAWMLRRERTPILQTWLYHADLLGSLAGRLAGVRSIVWNVRCSDMDLSCYPPSTGQVLRALRHLSRWPVAVIANSDVGRVAHEFLGLRPRRWEVIPNGFEIATPPATARAQLRQELALAPDTPMLGMLARFDPMKDHATFLHAASQLALRRPDVAFVLAGRGVTPDNAELQRLIAEGGLGGRVHMLGERADNIAILAALDVATLSSAFGEGCPNVIGEAMSCGVPCVATSVGDTARLIADTGLCVPPRDAEGLAGAWEDLLIRPAGQREALGARARERIRRYYGLDAMVARYLNLYEGLARR